MSTFVIHIWMVRFIMLLRASMMYQVSRSEVFVQNFNAL